MALGKFLNSYSHKGRHQLKNPIGCGYVRKALTPTSIVHEKKFADTIKNRVFLKLSFDTYIKRFRKV